MMKERKMAVLDYLKAGKIIGNEEYYDYMIRRDLPSSFKITIIINE